MRVTRRLAATTAAMIALAGTTLPSLAGEGITISDPYARASSPNAKSGAAFMAIINHGDKADRLLTATSDIAARVELHTHIVDGDVMRMVEVEEGFEIPAGGQVMLERGGKHVMFMGLTRSLDDGDTVDVTLTFENAGDMIVEIPVDLQRMPESHGGRDHGTATN